MGKELVEKKFSDPNMYLYHGLGAYGAEGWEAVVNIAGFAPLVAFLGYLEKFYSEDQRAGEKRGSFFKSILSSNQRPESKTVTELLITNMDCVLYQTQAVNQRYFLLQKSMDQQQQLAHTQLDEKERNQRLSVSVRESLELAPEDKENQAERMDRLLSPLSSDPQRKRSGA